ncbi:MAG: ATP-dependent carboxylate-amine ligase [Chloroflexi bacterium]|nr:ATP-dependent carboxylate-amine ligase [Chloroflexota bacterium]
MIEWKDAQPVIMEWPADIKKPVVGLVRDIDPYPRWTKYVRFLESNAIPFEIFDLNKSDWLEKVKNYDAVIGLYSNDPSHLDQFRRKYYFLEKNLGKVCYPSSFHLQLYEDKRLEADYCRLFNFPFAKTFTTYDKAEALEYIETLKFPVVSKLDPSSGSMAVELIRNLKSCRRLVNSVFSPQGRKTHLLYLRQKDYVYFQNFIPNDGYDIRVEISGNYAYGYRRKTPEGDFRASGMNLIVHGHLPPETVKIARQLYNSLKSPMLAVDFVHGLDGQYYIIEFSPFCQINKPSELHVNGEKGAYVFDTDEVFHHEKQLIWIHDLALQEFFRQEFLTKHGLSEPFSSNGFPELKNPKTEE